MQSVQFFVSKISLSEKYIAFRLRLQTHTLAVARDYEVFSHNSNVTPAPDVFFRIRNT